MSFKVRYLMIDGSDPSKKGDHADLHALDLEDLVSALQDVADLDRDQVLGSLTTLLSGGGGVLTVAASLSVAVEAAAAALIES